MAMGVILAAAGGVVAVNAAERPAQVSVAVDAALQRKTSAAKRGAVRNSRTPAASPRSAGPSAKALAPKPVAGLNQTQMNNAAVIVQVALKRGLPRRAMLVAVMTGLQESSLRNLANPSVPASLDLPNEGSGDDFDSIGVFQQRPSQGWGTPAELMDVRYAADAFYKRLLKVSDWESKSLAAAAQAVQRSALPDAYADHEKRAIKVLDALL